MSNKIFDNLRVLVTLFIITLTISFLIWIPYLIKPSSDLLHGLGYNLDFSRGFNTIYQNFDGLEYVVIAKTFYNPQMIAQIPQNLPAAYFPAHFPGFPILINIFAPFAGYLKSMLFVSFLFTFLASFAFYKLVKDFKLSSQPLFLSFVFLVLPARWVIVHSVGSPEPLFIFLTILALYFFLKFEDSKKPLFIWLTALASSSALLTRPPGILIFAAFVLYVIYKNFKSRSFGQLIKNITEYYPLLLIPVSLFGLFLFFQNTLGDFWAYFHTGDNIHLTFPPFQVFNKHQFWVGDIWLEDMIYIFILGYISAFKLLKSLPILGFFVLVFTVASSFIVHRDISRYILPIAPFVLIALDKEVTSKEFKIALIFILLAVYLYSQNFILENVAPVSHLGLFN